MGIGLILAAAVLTANADSAYLWGDQGDGTYVNPVLNADYSDPDVIRVGDTYYMTASDFHFLGMQVLESKDMVNWKIISQIYRKFDLPGWDGNNHYAGGSWAPAIRHHDGKFWVYFCTPDEGLFMSTATNPAGPWEPLHQVMNVKKWEDPCPLWDDDGQAYLLRSAHGAGPIILHKMSQDGKELLDKGDTIYKGPVAEGPKFLRKDGWYYISIPEGGVGQGWQTVLRSKNLYGPYESKKVLETGPTAINGPHQGALVDTPDGEWWFFHFQETSPMGRVVHLQPVTWKDGWPQIGVDYDGNGTGNPVTCWPTPYSKASKTDAKGLRRLFKNRKADADSRNANTPFHPQTSDDFDSGSLGLQWQFCHNPHDGFWSIENGQLKIKAQQSRWLMMAHNILTQKLMGWRGNACVTLDCSAMANGQKAGLVSIGQMFYGAGVMKEDGKLWLYLDTMNRPQKLTELDGSSVCIGLEYDARTNVFQLKAGADKDSLQPIGKSFQQRNGNWKGSRIGLYTYNSTEDSGTAVFDNFIY